MIFNPFLLLRQLLFVYQQEVYVTEKLLSFAYSRRVFEKTEKRQSLDWTLKAKLFYFSTLLLFSVTFICLSFLIWLYFPLFSFLFLELCLYGVLFILLPLFLVTVNVLFLPLDAYLKKKRIQTTKEKMKKHKSHLTVIGITGSYGKTSVKELVTAVLEEKYSVIATKENKNTPLGIAEMVDEISVAHQFFVVEMGAYHRGDIQELCDLVSPDFGVLTGINEQHLERQGSLQNIILTKNELTQAVPKTGKMWVNGENANAKTSAPSFAQCPVSFYSSENIVNVEYSDLGEQKITHKNGSTVATHILADYFPSLVDLAFQIGEQFEIPEHQVKKALEKIGPTEHRLEPKYFKDSDVLIIDDAFNGNPDGALSAMKTLSRFKNRNRIYLTPGLVELGEKTQEIHEWLGKNLAFHTDKVWLIQKSVTPFILAGLEKSHFPQEKITIFQTDVEAHQACKTLLKAGDVLLIQNDWTDNYS